MSVIMQLPEGLEWAAHSCALMASLPGTPLPVRILAEFFDLPEPYLGKQLQKLSAAGIVKTRRGPSGGYMLADTPENISLLQIVEAVDGPTKTFKCTEIRARGPSAVAAGNYLRPCGIARAMWAADAAWRRALAEVSLHELVRRGMAETPPEQVERGAEWIRMKLQKTT